KNIRINAIAPGSVMTPLIKNMFGGEQAARDTVLPMIPMGRISETRAVSQLGRGLIHYGPGHCDRRWWVRRRCRSTLAGARRHIQRLRRWLDGGLMFWPRSIVRFRQILSVSDVCRLFGRLLLALPDRGKCQT